MEEREMTGRERTMAAVEFRCPDRIPVAFPPFQDTDIEVVSYSSPSASHRATGEDEWGCRWRSLDKTMGRIIRHPLSNWEDFASYRWPDPLAPGRFEEAQSRLSQYRAEGKYVLGWMGTLFERMHQLRGFDTLLEDLYLRPERVKELSARLYEFQIQVIHAYGRLGLDGLDFLDDWGTETSLMISPGTWREFFKPLYRGMFDAAREAGMHTHLHSDGQISAIIPDLIECGLDALEVAQPGILGIERLARDFGRKVCFWGLADKQNTLVRGAREEIESEVKRLIDFFAFPEGGFIARGQMQDYGPLEIPEANVTIMYHAFKRKAAEWVATNRPSAGMH